MSADITLTFPDGSKRPFKAGITGKDVAESIAKSLAKRTVAMALEGEMPLAMSRPVVPGLYWRCAPSGNVTEIIKSSWGSLADTSRRKRMGRRV